jgi:Uma2 family endonuclease
MVVQEKRYTADEFWGICQLPENDGKHLELINGVIEEGMAPTGEQHGDLASELNMRIRMYVKVNKLGRVTAAETGYVMFTDPDGQQVILAPDVGFIARERMAAAPSKKFVGAPPDLAVEVISPSEIYSKVVQKALLYLQYGTRQVWIVDLSNKIVSVYVPGEIHTFDIHSTLDGGDVLPGFSLPIGELFAEPE